MGLLDHRRSWYVGTTRSPEECAATFTGVLEEAGTRGPVARWRLHRSPVAGGARVVATYDGRSPWQTPADLARRPRTEGLEALGSQVTFEAVRSPAEPVTRCSLWLSRSCQVWVVFTAEARVVRGYVQGVVHALADADPGAEVTASRPGRGRFRPGLTRAG